MLPSSSPPLFAPDAPSYTDSDFDDAASQEKSLAGWDQCYRQLSAGRFRGRTSSLAFPGLSVVRERMNMAVEQTFRAPEGSLVFFGVQRTSGGYREDGRRHGAMTVGFLRQLSDRIVVTEPDSDIVMVVADLAAFSAGADVTNPFGCGLEPASEVVASLASPGSQADVLSAWLVSLLGLYGSGSASKQLETLLPDLICDRMSGLMGTTDFQPTDTRGAGLAIFHRIHDWVEAHPREPVTVTALARHLALSPATLRKAVLDVSGHPLDALLMARRLDRARRAIVEARGTDARISDIALDWGFMHWGRFSARYRAHFGELPSQTLRGPPRASPGGAPARSA